jgi:hypothetical protein
MNNNLVWHTKLNQFISANKTNHNQVTRIENASAQQKIKNMQNTSLLTPEHRHTFAAY